MSNEARYYDALKRITKYQTVEKLRRGSQTDWGLDFEEALSYAYENVIEEAKSAIKGKRRPKDHVFKAQILPVANTERSE